MAGTSRLPQSRPHRASAAQRACLRLQGRAQPYRSLPVLESRASLTPCWHRPRSLHGTFIFRPLTTIKTYLDYFQSDSPLNRCSSGGQVLCPHPKRRKAKQNETKRTGPGPRPCKRASSRPSAVPRAGSGAPRAGPQPPARPPWQQGQFALLSPMFTAPPSLSPPELPQAAHGPSTTYPQQKAWQLSRLVAGSPGGWRLVSPSVPARSPSSSGCCCPRLPPAHRSSGDGLVFNSNGFVF